MYKDFEEFLVLLHKHRVEYLLIGGYAVSFYSNPRNTEDIDIFVNPTFKNAEKIVKVLTEFGFGSSGITVDDLVKKDQVIQLGNPPIRIDLLTSIEGVDFQSAFKNRIISKLGNIKVNVISLNDLLHNKEKANRPKDKEAINWIKKYRKK